MVALHTTWDHHIHVRDIAVQQISSTINYLWDGYGGWQINFHSDKLEKMVFARVVVGCVIGGSTNPEMWELFL